MFSTAGEASQPPFASGVPPGSTGCELQARASAAGYRVASPRTYRYDFSGLAMLEEAVGRSLLRELRDVDEQLGSPELGEVHDRIRELTVRGIEVHEIQHRRDYGRPESVPPVLERYVGAPPAGARPTRWARRSVTEVSAFLAERGCEAGVTTGTLGRLMAYVFDPDSWDSIYALTAVAVLESLARSLGIEHGPLVRGRAVDRPTAAAVYLAVIARSPADVRAALPRRLEGDFRGGVGGAAATGGVVGAGSGARGRAHERGRCGECAAGL